MIKFIRWNISIFALSLICLATLFLFTPSTYAATRTTVNKLNSHTELAPAGQVACTLNGQEVGLFNGASWECFAGYDLPLRLSPNPYNGQLRFFALHSNGYSGHLIFSHGIGVYTFCNHTWDNGLDGLYADTIEISSVRIC